MIFKQVKQLCKNVFLNTKKLNPNDKSIANSSLHILNPSSGVTLSPTKHLLSVFALHFHFCYRIVSTFCRISLFLPMYHANKALNQLS